MRRNLFAHGLPDVVDWLRSLLEYQFKDRLDRITCPVLVTGAENDFLLESARELYALLPGPKTWIEFSVADGAGEHCEQGNRTLFNQRAFDWLDETLNVFPKN
jgi:pimeloyl-ACP methyl ester carboxylesterase